MHSNNESLLVMSSLIFGIVLYILILAKGQKWSLLTGKNIRINKAKFPDLLRFLGVVTGISITVGLISASGLILTLKYVGLNLVISVIMGINLFMFEKARSK